MELETIENRRVLQYLCSSLLIRSMANSKINHMQTSQDWQLSVQNMQIACKHPIFHNLGRPQNLASLDVALGNGFERPSF